MEKEKDEERMEDVGADESDDCEDDSQHTDEEENENDTQAEEEVAEEDDETESIDMGMQDSAVRHENESERECRSTSNTVPENLPDLNFPEFLMLMRRTSLHGDWIGHKALAACRTQLSRIQA